ncbi:hypothetical protein GALL_341910 [mine drainage metagenome]|uniref:Uncharacterized protein n=1 Tax=mine drainage metagenome TaxID=410659 RepID=A0A1J5QKG2_9ZZZZ
MRTTGSAHDLPRSVLLAVWLDARPSDGIPLDRALNAIQLDDEPHTVAGWAEAEISLRDALSAWSRHPVACAALLPAPGDVAGVPAAVSAAAVEAGECVLVETDGRFLAAVPVVEQFGNVYESGHLVRWDVSDIPSWRTSVLGQVGSLADAERRLRTGLLQATEALAALDVARWRPDAAEAIAGLRRTTPAGWGPPPSLDARRANVISTATRLLAIVRLATEDDGGAVNLWQADQRSTALREVDRIARHALAAASTSPLGA